MQITYDDDVRQVELEIQQAYSNLQQNRELIQSQEKNVELADEAVVWPNAPRRRSGSSVRCAERDSAIAHSAINTSASAVWI